MLYFISLGILIVTGRNFYLGGSRIISLALQIYLLLYGILWFFTIAELFFNKLTLVTMYLEIFKNRIRTINSSSFLRFVLGAIISFQLAITAYSNFKQNIWTYVENTHDKTLHRIDTGIHIGQRPLSELRCSKLLRKFALFIDNLYYFYFPNKIIMLAIFLFVSGYRSKQLQLFLLGQNLLWGIGVYLFLIYPALGPCYFQPQIYYKSGTPMIIAYSLQNALLRQHNVLYNFPDSFHPVPFLGISAMPSFHVAASFYYFLSSFWMRKWWISVYCGLFFAGIFLGSIYTGWHYLLDGIAGMIWAGCIYLFMFLLRKKSLPVLSKYRKYYQC